MGLLCWDVGGLGSSAMIGVEAVLVFRDWAHGGWARDWEGSDPIHILVADSCRSNLFSPIWCSSVAAQEDHGQVRSSRGFPMCFRRDFLCRKWFRSLRWPMLGVGAVVGCWPLWLLLVILSEIGCRGFRIWDLGGCRIRVDVGSGFGIRVAYTIGFGN
jgi:hypothetical protein